MHNVRGLLQSILLIAGVILLSSAAASILGGYPLAVDRKTLWITPYTDAVMVLSALITGLILVAMAFYTIERWGLRFSVGELGLMLVLVEAMLIGSIIVVKLGLKPTGGAFNYISIERSLWAMLGCLSIAVLILFSLILVAAIFKPGILHWLPTPKLGGRLGSVAYSGGQVVYLIMALVVGALSVLLPHTPYFNPGMKIVSTDTYFNLRWIRVFEQENGFIPSLRETAGALRPLYIVFLYATWRLTAQHLDTAMVLDVVVPLIGFTLLAMSVYATAKWLQLPYPGQAALASILYWAPFFVYGGFQTNLLALPLALTAYALLVRGRTACSAILLYLLGLWHPWTLVYYTIAALLYLILEASATTTATSQRMVLLGRILAIIASSIASLATLLLILAWGERVESIAGIYKPMTLSMRFADKLLFVFYIYVWGTMLRPEIHIPGVIASLDRRVKNLWPLIAPALGFVVLKPVAAFRLLLEAPYPLVHGWLDHRIFKFLVLPVATATWLYLVLNSPPT